MKKTLMLTLVAVLALGVAGITWASHPAADEAAAPAALEAEAGSSVIERVENADPAAELDALFSGPVETGACCMADCMNERTACWDACGSDMACREQCSTQYQACTSHC